MEYVLITAARNEGLYIEETIKSVLAQTVLPKKWVIVSDRSVDNTDLIVSKYAASHRIIEFVRRENGNESGFASKVHALRLGYDKLKDITYDFIGHLDGDISLDGDYYEKILKKFRQNSRLGLAGGLVLENYNGQFLSRSYTYDSSKSVAGGIQLFRRRCYEAIGGFVPIEAGGEDWYAEIMARMKGWEAETFSDLKVFHHKPSKTARGPLRDGFRQGVMDYSLGSHPVFEVIKCIGRVREKPYIVIGLLRLAGFAWCYLRKKKRVVPIKLIESLRREQLEKLKSALSGLRTRKWANIR